MPVIGFISSVSAAPSAHLVAAFRQGLKVIGFVEGQNVAIDFHWAAGKYDRLPTIAAELVRREVGVLVAVGGAPAVLPAVAATPTIPIVFSSGSDPIELGILRSLNRPIGNATGVYLLIWRRGKRLGFARSGSEFRPHSRAPEPQQCQRRNPVKRGEGGSARHRSEEFRSSTLALTRFSAPTFTP